MKVELASRLGALWRHPVHLLWVFLAYLPFLGGMSVPLAGEQNVYISTALEMRNKGSWLVPYLFGEPSYLKPPFQYWATLGGWKLAGFNLLGTKLPSALCVVLAAWLLGEISWRLQNKRGSVNAGLWFAATLGAFTFGTAAQPQIYVCLFYLAAWWSALKFFDEPWGLRRPLWLYLAFAIAGSLAWVDGPLYSVFWVSGFFLYSLIAGEWELIRSRHLYLAGALGALLSASWNLTISGLDSGLPRPVMPASASTIWLALLYFSVPFTLFLIPGARAVRSSRRRVELLRFSAAYALVPALYFTFRPSRSKTDLLILLPLIALWFDWTVVHASRVRQFRFVTALTGILMGGALGMAGWLFFRAEWVPSWIAAGFVAIGLALVLTSLARRMRAFAFSALAGWMVLHAAAMSFGEADLLGLREYDRGKGGQQPLGMLDLTGQPRHEVGLLSVALGKPITRLTSVARAKDFVVAGGALALSPEQAELWDKEVKLGTEPVRKTPWRRWSRKQEFPFREILLEGFQDDPEIEIPLAREFTILSLK